MNNILNLNNENLASIEIILIILNKELKKHKKDSIEYKNILKSIEWAENNKPSIF